MNSFLPLLPWLIAMLVLIFCSGFFSASEAALFSLRPSQRRTLKNGTPNEKVAYRLLTDPDRLLSAVLFWNLVINTVYFALSSVVALRMEKEGFGQGAALAFAMFSLLAIIFFSEMMPKSFAVLRPLSISRAVSIPLTLFVRMIDPVMPLLESTTLVARRLLAPKLKTEDYLDSADLERAIDITGSSDASVIRQEQAVLQNIVQLSNIRIDEWMRPRTQFDKYTPPVSLTDLDGKLPASGYLLVTGTDSEEIEKAIRLDNQYQLPEENLEKRAEPVQYMPWSATVADALERMSHRDREVTVVLNEFGETIGILTIEDILETVFTYSPSRSKRLLDQNPLHILEEGRWAASGMMSLRRLARELELDLPDTHSVTVGGVVQEAMQRLAEVGDEGDWGPLHFRVVEIEHRGNMLLELTMRSESEESE